MSISENTQGAPMGQDKSKNNSQTEVTQLTCQFLRLGIRVMELILLAVTATAVSRWGKRFELLSQAPTLPSEGYGDVRAVAAHLNLTEDGAYALLKRIPNLPRYKPGTSILFRYEDIAKFSPLGGAEFPENDPA